MEKIRTKKGEVWVDGDVLMMKLSGNIEAEDIKEIAKIGIGLAEKFKNVKYNAVDISGVRWVPLSARKTAFDYSDGRAGKVAFICTNPVARIIGSFFLRRYKMPVPAKMFSSIEEARKWFVREGVG